MSSLPRKELYQVILETADGLKHYDGEPTTEYPQQMSIRRPLTNLHSSQAKMWRDLRAEKEDMSDYHVPIRTYKREGHYPNVTVKGDTSRVIWNIFFKEVLESLK